MFRARERRGNLKRYGLTLDEYERLLQQQGHRCAICRRSKSGGRGKRMHVDHDHSSKRIRGLLCHGCNTGLGAFCESPAILLAALNYLQSGVIT